MTKLTKLTKFSEMIMIVKLVSWSHEIFEAVVMQMTLHRITVFVQPKTHIIKAISCMRYAD